MTEARSLPAGKAWTVLIRPATPRLTRCRREHLRGLHPQADRHVAAGAGDPAGGDRGVPAAPGRAAAPDRPAHHPGHACAAGGEPGDDGLLVATPLERRFGRIAGIAEITSVELARADARSRSSSTWSATSTPPRATCRPRSTPPAASCPPTCRRGPPTARSTRRTRPSSSSRPTRTRCRCPQVYDIANSIIAQKISQVEGVGQVTVGGGQQPSVRVQADPAVARRPRPQPRGRAHARSRAPPSTSPRAASPARRRRTPSPPTISSSSAAEYQQRHRHVPERRRRAPRRRGHGRRRRAEQPRRRLDQQQALGRARHPAPARGQHHRHHRPGDGAAPHAEQLDLAGDHHRHRARPGADHPRLGARRRVHPRPQRRRWWCWSSSCSSATGGRPSSPASPCRSRCWRRSA